MFVMTMLAVSKVYNEKRAAELEKALYLVSHSGIDVKVSWLRAFNYQGDQRVQAGSPGMTCTRLPTRKKWYRTRIGKTNEICTRFPHICNGQAVSGQLDSRLTPRSPIPDPARAPPLRGELWLIKSCAGYRGTTIQRPSSSLTSVLISLRSLRYQ